VFRDRPGVRAGGHGGTPRDRRADAHRPVPRWREPQHRVHRPGARRWSPPARGMARVARRGSSRPHARRARRGAARG